MFREMVKTLIREVTGARRTDPALVSGMHLSDTCPTDDRADSDDGYDNQDNNDDSVVNFLAKHHDILPSSSVVEDPADDILDWNYGRELPRPCLPDILEKLAKAVSSWLHVTSPREKINQFFKITLIPRNVEGLQPVHINELLYEI